MGTKFFKDRDLSEASWPKRFGLGIILFVPLCLLVFIAGVVALAVHGWTMLVNVAEEHVYSVDTVYHFYKHQIFGIKRRHQTEESQYNFWDYS